MKHKLKLFVRNAYARLLFHSGLHALVDRMMPWRVTILAGHCVTAPSNERLPLDMKIDGEKLARMLRWFARRYEVARLSDALERMRAPGEKSVLVLTMDDGYRDNATHLVPLLGAAGVSATVFLESRPLVERRVNWSHKFFWLHDRLGALDFVRRVRREPEAESIAPALDRLAAEGVSRSYPIKRLFKYELEPARRNALVDRLFAELGGDEPALCDELYLTFDDARTLRDAGVELGGHTVHHEILSKLDAADAERETRGCRDTVARELGVACATFAYPFGRRWDYSPSSIEAVKRAGFRCAVTTHAGTNDARTDPYQLKRLMIDANSELHLLAAEACGGFDLLRRIGIDLSE